MILGIDPGVNGAYTILDINKNIIACRDLPLLDKESKHLDGEYFCDLIKGFDIKLAIIEDVHSAPKQGVASTFKFGYSAGLLTGIILGMNIPIKKVRPYIWKHLLNLGTDKKESLALANRLFPNNDCFKLVKDHNKAESALIAYFGLRSWKI